MLPIYVRQVERFVFFRKQDGVVHLTRKAFNYFDN